ncbi:MAG: hypothetical protein ABSA16_13835 [Thermoguttaceae bacterium]|jgi:hypothetical protein
MINDFREYLKTATPLSRQREPDDMPLETWQVELRRQFDREQKFRLCERKYSPRECREFYAGAAV